MKRKVIYVVLLFNLLTICSYGLVVIKFNDMKNTFTSDGIKVIAKGNYLIDGDAEVHPITIEQQKQVEKLKDVKSIEYANASIFGENLEESDIYIEGIYGSKIDKNYNNLKLIEGRNIENNNEVIISEKVQKEANESLLGKTLLNSSSLEAEEDPNVPKVKIVGVYASEGDNEVEMYTKNPDEFKFKYLNDDYVANFFESKGSVLSTTSAEKTYGDSFKMEAYVQVNDSKEVEKVSEEIKKIIPDATLISNESKLQDVFKLKLLPKVIVFELACLGLIFKMHLNEKKQK